MGGVGCMEAHTLGGGDTVVLRPEQAVQFTQPIAIKSLLQVVDSEFCAYEPFRGRGSNLQLIISLLQSRCALGIAGWAWLWRGSWDGRAAVLWAGGLPADAPSPKHPMPPCPPAPSIKQGAGGQPAVQPGHCAG